MTEETRTPPEPPKPVLQLKSQKFRETRQADWRTLSGQLDKVEKRGLGSLSVDELLLYRSAVSSLSMAQSISLDRNLITYLQALCVRAYVNVYGPQTRIKDVLHDFFIEGWPRAVRKLWVEIIVACLVLVAGAVAGWLMCAHDQSWYTVFLPGEQGSRGIETSAEALRKTIGGAKPDDPLPPFAVFLMTHNVKVAIATFAFGVVFGLPTFALTLYTGVTLGAMVWLFARQGLGFEFAAWLTIHGTTELFALCIAAGCGFHLARRLMFPGDATRKAALSEAGILTGTAMIGVAVMLTVAGCLEGVGRQLITNPFLRIGIGAVMLVLWLSFYTWVGRGKRKGKGA